MDNYRIETLHNEDFIMYDVFTDDKKVFTLKLGADGVWRTHDSDTNTDANNQALIDEIGNAILKHYTA